MTIKLVIIIYCLSYFLFIANYSVQFCRYNYVNDVICIILITVHLSLAYVLYICDLYWSSCGDTLTICFESGHVKWSLL